MVQNNHRNVNPSPLPSLDIATITDRWYSLASHEAFAPDGLRIGLARERTALLANVPSWRLPDVLEALAVGAGHE